MSDFDLSQIKLGEDLKPLSAEEIAAMADDPPKQKPTPKKAAPKKTTNRSPGRPTKQSAIQELEEEISGFLMLAGTTILMRDKHPDGSSCGELFITPTFELAPEAANLAEKLAIVGVDNKYIKKFFDLGGETGKWMMLALAFQPFIMGPYINHVVMRRIENASREG